LPKPDARAGTRETYGNDRSAGSVELVRPGAREAGTEILRAPDRKGAPMKRGIQLLALGNTASLFLAATFTVCALFDLAFPGVAMFGFWRMLLPGVASLTWKAFFVGLAESYLYGWYFALLWVPLYNFFVARERA
jgi:hypothetical protein